MRTTRQWYRKRQLILCDFCGHAKYKHDLFRNGCSVWTTHNSCSCRSFLMPKHKERKYLTNE